MILQSLLSSMYSLLLHNFKHGQLTIVVWSPDKTLDMLITASLLTVTSVYTQLYPYYYSVCACPVPGCLYTYCVQYYGLILRLLCLLQPKKNNQKKKKQTKTKTALPLHSPPSLFPISYYEHIFQILFLLSMYSIALARLSHKPSWAGCISCRWH